MAITLGGGSYVTSGLQLYLDSTMASSYPGSGTTWTDLSGNAKHGTLTNGPTYSNGSIVFDGVDDYVACGSFGTFYTAGTLSFRIKPSVFENYRNPLTTNLNGSNVGIRFEELTSGYIGVVIGNDAGTYVGYSYQYTQMRADAWYYITFVWNTSINTCYGYLNGMLQITAGHSLWPTTIPAFAIGNGFATSRYYKGAFSNVSLYNRALTAAEIQQNFQAASQGITFADSTAQGTAPLSSIDNGSLLNVTQFSSSGSFTWYKPVGCTRVLVKLVGGGGGAAGYCESGGSGGYSEKMVDMTGVSTVAVTVGGGGASVAYYAAAGDGGTTSFGGYCSASGGYGSNRNSSHSGGVGGTGSSGNINLNGGIGSGHTNGGSHAPWGRGGTSFFGGSGTIRRDTTSNKMYAGAAGTGGPGARTNDGGGAVGANGGESGTVIVYAYS